MSDYLSTRTLLIASVFFLAGIVKGVTGMGLPTVAMGVLGAVMSPVMAASLLIIPSFVTNVWQLITGPSFAKLIKRLSLMLLGIVIGTVVGSRLLTGSEGRWTTIGLGGTLVLYAVYGLLARPLSLSPHTERWLAPVVGIITGLITGGTGVFVIPAVPYPQTLGLDKNDLIQALGLSFTISTVALALGLAGGGALGSSTLVASTLAVAPALLGMWVGQLVRQRISPTTFRKWFFVCLIMLGLDLIVRPLI